MRYSLLAAALAVAMGSTSFSASAADNRDQTIAELKAQLEALTAKVAELEERSDAQSDVNIDTAAQLDKITTGSPKIAAVEEKTKRPTSCRTIASSSSRV